MKPKPNIVGRSEAGKPIVDGRWVFWLLDSQGLPLEIIIECLQKIDCAFDILTFVEAALKSGNWNERRLNRLLIDTYEGDKRDEVIRLVEYSIRKIEVSSPA